nr:hypothetical protein OG409_01270 [Streptomyces sp. NBC_00974]
MLTLPYRERRRRLEVLFAAHALAAPWTFCPMTTDPARAARAWTKIRRRDTTEAIVGAITGTLARPQPLILGRRDRTGRLRTIGPTVPLRPDPARQVAEHLAAAGPGHP